MPAERRKVSKESVNYRESATDKRCGNCAMFNTGAGTCDLVKGDIQPNDVCDRWVTKP
jgi:hypothetical protein